jgi:pyrroloquinoline-quinone synthase
MTNTLDTRAEPWTDEEFIAALKTQGQRYHNLHPFHVRMNNGELTKEELQTWVANRYMYQIIIPRKDAAILMNCPERDIRREWISRIYDHDGDDTNRGGIESWFVLGDTMASERLVLPAVRYACEAYLTFCRQKPWIEAVASSLTELFGPAAIKTRLEGMEKHYPWIDPAGLDYFRARLHLAPADAQYALDLTVEHCRSFEAQQKAVAALSFKLDMLWVQLDAIDQGDTRPVGART